MKSPEALSPSRALEIIREMVQKTDAPVFTMHSDIFRDPFRIFVAVVLSSRTRDQVTIAASRRLFDVATDFAALAALGVERLASLIKPVGFYRVKARNLTLIARKLSHREAVPQTIAELTALPGVGLKSASLILQLCFNQPYIAVDTHVGRISRRLGWTTESRPEKIAASLHGLFNESQRRQVNILLVAFGQSVCRPVLPLCKACSLASCCLYRRESDQLPAER